MVLLVRLKALRIRRALSQADLAEKSGVARTTINRLERELEEPYPSTIRKLAEALDVEPHELMEAEK